MTEEFTFFYFLHFNIINKTLVNQLLPLHGVACSKHLADINTLKKNGILDQNIILNKNIIFLTALQISVSKRKGYLHHFI